MADRKTLCDVAYEFLAKENSRKSFNDIWEYVAKETNLSEEESKDGNAISKFYTNLLLDGRFVVLKNQNQMWNLRVREKYDDIKMEEMNAIYADVETTDKDLEDEEDITIVEEETSEE